ncbi:hypothetical protein CAEBREN_08449 [Caenorhabditis brenneri]|uniref:KIX domain-containing protein n=1 Tax=Caenorhabditis brenneri TaxID=135651 RepID=G0MKA5_CAEBE|nr:hypothetical protein CAEBREN_08449 [Caenorhabditis brenneri]
MPVDRSWTGQVSRDLRNHLIGRLIRAIFPEDSDFPVDDAQRQEVIRDAREIERQMFEAANDREEYYELLAEKIYNIQRDIAAGSR